MAIDPIRLLEHADCCGIGAPTAKLLRIAAYEIQHMRSALTLISMDGGVESMSAAKIVAQFGLAAGNNLPGEP